MSEEWDLSKIKSKDERIVTHTYLNTKILPNESQEEEEKEGATLTFRKKIEEGMPASNRNMDIRSSTYNKSKKDKSGEISASKQKVCWRDQDKDSLVEIITNAPLGGGKKGKKVPKVTAHHEEVKLQPCINVKHEDIKPKVKKSINISSISHSKRILVSCIKFKWGGFRQ